MHTPTSLIEAERFLQQGHSLSPEQLADVLERDCSGPILECVRQLLIDSLRRKRRRGPKPRVVDLWTGADILERYLELRLKFREDDQRKKADARVSGTKLARGDESAYERAAKATVAEFHDVIGSHVSGKRFLNLLSELQKINVREEDYVTPDPFDPPDHLPDPKSGE